MEKINIAYVTDETYNALKKNANIVTEKINKGIPVEEWIKDYSSEPIEELKFKIPKINLKLSTNGKYSEVDYENSIMIYEALKYLPRYVLTNNRFWVWFILYIAYDASKQAVPLDGENTLLNMWLLDPVKRGGHRSGIFFNVMARCFFRVEMTVDENLENKYELTKFVIDSPTRFREFTWRSSISNNKKIMLPILKAEKDFHDKYGIEKSNFYTSLAKDVFLYGSIRILDIIDYNEMYNFAFNKLEEYMKL